MVKAMGDLFMQLGSAVGGLIVITAFFRDHFPPQIREYLEKYTSKLVRWLYPYIQITFPEYTGERLKKSEIYTSIQSCLTEKATTKAKKLKADAQKDSSQALILSMDDNEEVTDEFRGAKVWWSSNKVVPRSMSMSFYPAFEERRYYKLVFHKNHRDLITSEYVKHVLDEGKAIASRNRQRKLYTNNPSNNWYGYKSTKWSHVVFEHPATFDTLAMDPNKKHEIISDLEKFRQGKEYYAKIGKAWKRGYLLFGPPGTGKSTMIAAIANFMNYDVYDLELTAVKDNSELRKLLIDTASKSIIVIEDIDCSLDLTGQRKDKKKKKKDDDEDEDGGDPGKKLKKEEEKDSKESKVTLSGLLNFIDGIWSACGGERIIIFTTNFVDKLDPALIRRGRMDKHIEMSYCCFESFKILARNYIDVEDHRLFGEIKVLLGEVRMTPADVAENLMPKSTGVAAETCLKGLIEALEAAKKEESRKKGEEEEEKKKEAMEINGAVENGKLEEKKVIVKENGVIN